MADQKTCAQCKTSKPEAAFLPSRFTADCLTDLCTSCILANAQRDRAEREQRRRDAAKLEEATT